MTKDEGSSNAQMTKKLKEIFDHSDFVALSSLGIRHSSFSAS
jgi:hypothetical protein